VVPASNTVRFLIFSGVILLFGAVTIIATKGQLGRPTAVPAIPQESDREHMPDAAEGRKDPRQSDPPDA
jgi:hypothetical protein